MAFTNQRSGNAILGNEYEKFRYRCGEGALRRDRLRDGLVSRFGPPQLFSDYCALHTLRFQGLRLERVGVYEGVSTSLLAASHLVSPKREIYKGRSSSQESEWFTTAPLPT